MKLKLFFISLAFTFPVLAGCNNTPSVEYCFVNYNTNGGSYIAPTKVEKGNVVNPPISPTKEPTIDTVYTFNCWTLNDNVFDFATPITQDITLKAKWFATDRVFNYVYFNTNGGEPSFIRPVNVEKGHLVSKPQTSPTKENYVFDNWCLEEDLENQNNFFDFEKTQINDDTTIFARYRTSKHVISFDLNGGSGKIDAVTVDDGNNALSVKPNNPTHDLDENNRYYFEYWELDGKEFDFSKPVTPLGNITLRAKWKSEKRIFHTVNVFDNNHLLFVLNDEPLDNYQVEHNQSLEFNVTVEQSSDLISYKVPDNINIYLKDSSSPLSKDEYNLEFNDELHTSATIQIEGNHITDDICVKNNDAISVSSYQYKVWSNYGVNCDNTEGEITKEQNNFTITFTRKSEYSPYALPSKDTIFLKVDNNPWFSISSDVEENYCSYNETTGKLTINSIISYRVDIKARASNYYYLEDVSWDDINNYSINGLAEYYFCLGDKKALTVNEKTHYVKIIGFNHDIDMNNKKVGITFEFDNLLCDSNSDLIISQFQFYRPEDLNRFFDSTLYRTVNSVFDMIPEEVSKYIKPIKKYSTPIIKDYPITVTEEIPNCKLFVLSASEYCGENQQIIGISWSNTEGSQYEYYKIHGLEKKASACSGLQYNDYWTRSVNLSSMLESLAISTSPSIIGGKNPDKKCALAPAFCI